MLAILRSSNFLIILFQDKQKAIVDKHNALRRQLAKGLETKGVNGPQPKAADMYELVWDPVLAASAQRFNLLEKLTYLVF